MAVTREARYLSGNDVGKMLKIGKHFGVIEELYFDGSHVSVYLRGATAAPTLDYSTPVTIIGQDQQTEEP